MMCAIQPNRKGDMEIFLFSRIRGLILLLISMNVVVVVGLKITPGAVD